MTRHSEIMGGSSAERRIQCPGSAALEASMPRPEVSAEAREGTALHEIIVDILEDTRSPYDVEHGLVRVTHEDGIVTELSEDTLREKFWPAYDAVQHTMNKWDVLEYVCELESVHTHLDPKGRVFGTLDIAGRGRDPDTEEPVCVIIELKFGSGVRVSPIENLQMGFYASGLIGDADEFADEVNKFVFVVVQPWHDGETTQHWVTDRAWIKNFDQAASNAVKRIDAKETALKVGRWCQFCKALPVCPAHEQALVQLASKKEVQLSNASAMDLARLLSEAEKVEKFIKALRKHAKEVAESGGQIPGYKLIEALGNRRWRDIGAAAIAAARAVGEDAWSKKLKTPKQMRLTFGKHGADFSALEKEIERPEKGTKLVSDSHDAAEVQIVEDIDIPQIPAMQRTGQNRK